MSENLGVIGKVFGLSLLLSIAIKYGGGFLPLSPNNITALVLVLLPTAVMLVLLMGRSFMQKPSAQRSGSAPDDRDSA